MISGLHIGTELRRFQRSKLKRVAIIAICILPILYSTLYLWSFWNPFGEVNRLPVALVNADKGTTVDGKTLNAGRQVADGLLEDKSLNWQEVSHQEALDGVRTGRYYFALEMTPGFSEAIASPAQKDNPKPVKATMQATYNDSNGYLSTVIGENAMRAVLNVVDTKISAQAVDKVLVGLQNAGSGIMRAADGAGKLDQGIGKLEDGSGKLADGLTTAKKGSAQLADGTDTLVDGTGKLKKGSSQLADGTAQLTEGVDQLAGAVDKASGKITDIQTRAQDLENKVNAYSEKVGTANSTVQTLVKEAQKASESQAQSAQKIREIADSVGMLPDPASQQSARNLRALADQMDKNGLGPESQTMKSITAVSSDSNALATQFTDPDSGLRSSFTEVNKGIKKFGELQNGVIRLRDGAHKLNDGAHQLDNGLGELQKGAIKLQGGAHQLSDGAVKLSTGADELKKGLGTAHAGSTELATKLNEGTKSLPTWTPSQRQEVSSVMGGPVQISDRNDAGENTFGAGLAPFFFALSLYIGAIIMFFLLRPLQRRAVSSGIRPFRAAIDGFLSPALIGVAQAASVVGLTLLLTPLEASTKLGLFGFSVLVALMYVAINQMFNCVFPPGPGRVGSMAFLMIQLVASGGLYPIETEPRLLQTIHPFMPMTYAVNGFRQLLYGEYDARLPIAILAIILFTGLALGLTTYAAARDRTWTMKRLHPAIDI